MESLIVVNEKDEWLRAIPGASVATAKDYITGPAADGPQYQRVINLCRCKTSQDEGYYVSLLGEARGHQPLPSAKTLEDLRAPKAPLLTQIEALIVQSIPVGDEKRLHIDSYFGVDPTRRHAAVSAQLFSMLDAPLVRARLRSSRGHWRLEAIRALTPSDIPAEHRTALIQAAADFLTGRPRTRGARGDPPALAILHNPDQPLPPSNAAALNKFLSAAQALGMRAEIIDRQAIERLGEFDALFIRDTTFLNHYTYEFSQRAAALGLVVIDDEKSILQCNNKVYLNELFGRHRIEVPRTVMVHRDNIDEIIPALGLPCVLKEPGGGFSLGVRKAQSEEELHKVARELLEKSELIIAQEYLPTEYDWRVTILDRRPLFVCKYFMAAGHWQVHKYESDQHLEGRTAALSVGEAPQAVVAMALRAANLIGDGLYGVDLKQASGRVYVMEINDNPNIDAGNEDGVLGPALYREVMGVFLRRITERRDSAPSLAESAKI